MIVQSTFTWANYLLPNSPYCMIYLWWETERENWSWSLLGVKGLKFSERNRALSSTLHGWKTTGNQYIFHLCPHIWLAKKALRQDRFLWSHAYHRPLYHFLSSIPSGGLHSTFSFFTSSQLVLNTVPPDSTNDLFMARLTSSLPSP